MKIQPWNIACNVLKNLFDSYGITVIVPVRLPARDDLEIVRRGTRPGLAGPHENGTTAQHKFPLPHITLFAIHRSLFVLPENPERQTRCLELLQNLRQTLPHGLGEKGRHTLQRLIEGTTRSHNEVKNHILDAFDMLSIPAETAQALQAPGNTWMSYTLQNYAFKICEEGALVLEIEKTPLLQDVQGQAASLLALEPPRPTPTYHLTLGHVDTMATYQRVTRLLDALPPPTPMPVEVGQVEVVAYTHRSLQSLIARKKLTAISLKERI